MKHKYLVLVLASVLAALAAEANIHYFSNVRDVQVKDPAKQNYVVVDPEIWAHTRPDLGDIRLYSGTREVPYALQVEGGSIYDSPRGLRILNLGTAAGSTSFVLDMTGLPEYDEVSLNINRKDFVTRATVEGSDDASSSKWTTLGSGALFDYSREKLGSNGSLRIPLSTFRYLRIVIPSGLEPKDIQGASGADTARVEAAWETIPVRFTTELKQGKSIALFELPKDVPVDRLRFVVPADKLNFRRKVRVEVPPDDKRKAAGAPEWEQIAAVDLTRVQVHQGKQTQVCESLEIPLHGTRAARWRITVENGDDLPLEAELLPQTLQRRLYFDPRGAAALQLYYGDEKLNTPVYDYAKFFNPREAKDAVQATLSPGAHNAAYTGRPDDRPWTERHGWVLWAAMGVAIVGIGWMALRGLKVG